MIIETPVVFFLIDGNAKELFINDKFIYASSFDPEKDVSMVVIKVKKVSGNYIGALEKEISDHYKKFAKLRYLKYFENGIDIQEGFNYIINGK